VTAIDVDQDIETVSSLVFNVVDKDEITLTSVHHNMCFEVAKVGAGIGGRFVNSFTANDEYMRHLFGGAS
jgi:hypothetical protein